LAFTVFFLSSDSEYIEAMNRKEESLACSIPTIHLNCSDKVKEAKKLRLACTTVGFFYLESHGLARYQFTDVLAASREFFELPLEEKRCISDHEMTRGYTAMEEETLDPSNQTKGDTKEGFYIGQEIPKDHALYNPVKLAGPNVWPGECGSCSISDHRKWKKIMQEYFSSCCDIGFRLQRLIALSLDLDEKFFDPHFTNYPLTALRLLHYSSEESKPELGVFACGAHSDYGMLTLLLTDANPGLQIRTLEGNWIPIPPREGAFIVNLGDMLERWTNGLYLSTVHRVISEGSYERFSIPFFYEPSFDTVVEVLECCIDENNPPKYSRTTSGRHLLEKYSQTHADFNPHDQKEMIRSAEAP